MLNLFLGVRLAFPQLSARLTFLNLICSRSRLSLLSSLLNLKLCTRSIAFLKPLARQPFLKFCARLKLHNLKRSRSMISLLEFLKPLAQQPLLNLIISQSRISLLPSLLNLMWYVRSIISLLIAFSKRLARLAFLKLCAPLTFLLLIRSRSRISLISSFLKLIWCARLIRILIAF